VKKKILLVLIRDRLTDLHKKGVLLERYYNPGNLFDEVHIVSTYQDNPDPSYVQKTVGTATLVLHSIPVNSVLVFLLTLGWRPFLLRFFAGKAVKLARRIQPDLIRCHGAHLPGFLGAEINRRCGIPYVISMHIGVESNLKITHPKLSQRVLERIFSAVDIYCLRSATMVLPVYKPIVPYLERIGVTRYTVCYNIITQPPVKTDYRITDYPKILCVNRQMDVKNPENLVRAVARIDKAHLTLVGTGPLHESLKALVAELGIHDRIRFSPRIQNEELVESLPGYDIFAVHTEHYEIGKSVMEATLAGLPVVINRRTGDPVPEFEDSDFVIIIENTVDQYCDALNKLIDDNEYREYIGKKAHEHAEQNWSPEIAEQKVVNIYRMIIENGNKHG
jgi:glycosyltransferase involved in cell wall biosynthesis